MIVRIQEVGIDCAEPVLVAFQRVPEPKSSPKNRLHLDLQVPDAAARRRAVALGARVIREPELGSNGDGFVVLADPEDNEFCFVVDESGEWMGATREVLIGFGQD